jgi:hypothetical protein
MESGAQGDERFRTIVMEGFGRLPGERDDYVREACQGDEALLRLVGDDRPIPAVADLAHT